jgi:hypothetical protein
MNEKELDAYLKKNLSIDIKTVGGSYGQSKYLEIELKLKGETISTIYIDE